MSSNHDIEQMRKMTLDINRCLQLVRAERKKILKIDELLRADVTTDTEKQHLASQLKELTNEMIRTYEFLEDDAKQPPPQVASMTLLARLNGFLQDVATSSTIPSAVTNCRDAFDWAQYTLLLLNYLSEMLKQPFFLNNTRARRLINPPKVESSIFRTQATPLENPHRRFEANLETVVDKFAKDHHQRMRYVFRYLERSTVNSVIELKLMAPPQMREYVTSDRRPVYYFKCLILVNNGVIDYSQFIAPHEEWRYLETSPKQVDLSVESRYELYRNISMQANIISRHLSNIMDDLKIVYQFLSFIARFHVLDDKCIQCKKSLRDFTPTTMMGDTMIKKASYHPNCK